jgi:AP-4 complex subunit epsilon-1
MSGAHLSKEFFDLVKAIGESKSKQEEDRIVGNEARLLKTRFQEKGLSKKLIKEALVRLIYVEMLGHDASFAYVHAIQLTAAGDLMQKKVGYLCAALTLSPEHEFRFMLVNQLQRDLGSANLLEVSTALVALCKLITPEMVPALLPSVLKLLTHEQAIVRKKTVLALHRIYQLDAGAVEHLGEQFRRVLYDKDPAVMGASLCLLHELARAHPQQHKDLVPGYVSILKQIVEHRLPKDFDYHRIPAPWIQIKLLKILALLGANDQRCSEGMYEVLYDTMKRANTGIYVGYAIVYECVRTVTSIYPNPVLLDAAAGAIARFVQSDSHNLKYIGVTGLAAIVRDHPRYAAEHQMVVLDCLEDPDETLKRKTLDLLFRMTNPVNAEVVVDKLVFFLKGAADKFLRQDLVARICQLAERFAPSNIWYVRTIARVFELGGDLVQSEVAHNLLRLLAEGAAAPTGAEGDEAGDRAGGDAEAEADEAMRREACVIFYDMFERSMLPDILLQVMFWTLGEYAYLLQQEQPLGEVLEVICQAAGRQGMSALTRGYGVSAAMKISAQLGRFTPEAAELVDRYSGSLDVDLQQKCLEFRELARESLHELADVLPVDASCEDFSEPDFGFLEAFVAAARARGAREYTPPSQAEVSQAETYGNDGTDAEQLQRANQAEPALKYDAYAKPTLPTAHSVAPALDYAAGAAAGAGTGAATNGASPAAAPKAGLNLSGVKSVWGQDGYGGGPLVPPVPQPSAFPVVAAATTPQPKAAPTPQTVPAYMQQQQQQQQHQQQALQSEPAAAPEPAKPREPTERERMAAALFGGLGAGAGEAPASLSRAGTGSGAAGAGTGARRRPPNVSTPPLQPAAAPALAAAASPVNLLDFDDKPRPGAQPAAQALDLLASLDIGDGGAATAPAPAASSGLLSMLDTPAPPAQPFQPLALVTAQFGQQWVQSPCEAKLAVALVGCKGVRDIEARIKAALGLGTVEVIERSEEAIFAGRELATSATVLVHAKKAAVGADLTVRSVAPDITTRAKQNLQKLLR